jgi:hypothetical protein
MTAHLVEKYGVRPLCPSGKRPMTEAEAVEALHNIARRGKDRVHSKPGRTEKQKIHCKACNWYHLTSWEGKYNMNRARRRR